MSASCCHTDFLGIRSLFDAVSICFSMKSVAIHGVEVDDVLEMSDNMGI